MLSSITPLGQRGRGMSWRRMVVAFWLGAVTAGMALFGSVGLVGGWLGLDRLNPWLLLAVVVAAGLLDLTSVRPPGPQRQVDENWLSTYRDWVVGLGYGAQLGTGFVTVVPTFGTWALLVVSASVGLPLAAAIGVAFGVGRSLLLIGTRKVRSPAALAESMRKFAAAETRGRQLAYGGYGMVLIVVVTSVLA